MNPAGLFSSSFDSVKAAASQLTDWPGGDRTELRPSRAAGFFRIALQSPCWKFGILQKQTGRKGHNSRNKMFFFSFKKLPDWDEREQGGRRGLMLPGSAGNGGDGCHGCVREKVNFFLNVGVCVYNGNAKY